ncbi:cop9 subunit [Grosmannia clavigera kw1407]|uniref:Cop9 subunit n=1 Tax=Grosmannia clavigera (strain kw1407 / UAMH 11150) TaxID=655863 RepID=F0XFA6_GROCL|nr:cop9 subunit [Grosmannia clavigera kw1407]EFX03452.1 cop9 subunit [Grosmannia clavigera kw1407]
MDHCAAVLRNFPPTAGNAASLYDDVYDKLIKAHINRVQRLFKDSAAVVAAHAIELLNSLDPATHTYSYLSLIDTILPADAALYDSSEPIVAEKILAFLMAFDPRQVRYVGSAFTHLFTAVGSGRIIPASIAVEALAQALQKLDPSGAMLTSNHLALARLAYHTDNALPALAALNKDIVFFPGAAPHRETERLCSLSLPPPSFISKDTGLTLPLKSTQVLDFDHLVGLLNCSVRDWEASHAAFARVISHPTRDNGVSKIMIEAHKKWVLTGLLLNGKVPTTPPNTTPYVSKAFSVVNKAYVQMAENFESPSAEMLVAEATPSTGVFLADGNESLVKEVLSAHPKWQIAHLRKVYVTVSIADIRTTIKDSPPTTVPGSDAETESLLQGMIDTGMIRAAIRRPAAAAAAAAAEGEAAGASENTYLEFLPEEEMTEADFAKEMAVAVKRIRVLKPLYKVTNEQLSLNRDYLKQVLRDQKREKEAAEREGTGAGSSIGDGLFYEADPDDEDLMTGP